MPPAPAAAPPAAASPRRDAARTRARLLAAARREFGRKGFAGARVDAIAARAGVRKALVFYYFQSKEGLFRALADERLAAFSAQLGEGLAPPAEPPDQWPRHLFGLGEQTLDWVRFFLWEGLTSAPGGPPLLAQEPRREQLARRVAWVAAHQRSGSLAPHFDSAQLAFFLYALGVQPYLLPQFTWLITGSPPDADATRDGYDTFAQQVVRLLARRPTRPPVVLPALPAPAAQRTPDRRARLLAAARKEAALHGFAGARLDAIARRAGVRRGLVAYHFGTKERLFEALADERAQPWPLVEGLDRDDPFQWTLGLFARGDETLDWVRIFAWEALSWDPAERPLLLEARRREGFGRRVAAVRAQQVAGLLPAQLDARHLTALLYTLGVYPLLLPQMAYLITGRWPEDEAFRADYVRFLLGLARALVGTSAAAIG